MTTITYRGYTTGAGGGLVTIEHDGQFVRVLRHAVRHSPTGMSWGHGGSGPADLARSLLLDVLGDDALCITCQGSYLVVYDELAHMEVPASAKARDVAGDRYSQPMRCQDCDGGYQRVPYQEFKWGVIAKLPPEQGWVLQESGISAWLERHRSQHPVPLERDRVAPAQPTRTRRGRHRG